MKVMFHKWCVDATGRFPVAVEPKRVDSVVWYSDAFKHAATGENFPAASNIIMQGKQEYLVQGTVAEITDALNAAT